MVDDATLQTIIITLGSIVAAAIGADSTRRVIRRRKTTRQSDVDKSEREAVEKYAADPGQFVRDVLRSNDQLTKRVEAAEEKADKLEKAFTAFRDKDRRFRNALARWFVDIMAAFESADIEMPYPRPGDEELLADVIPSALEATQPRLPFHKPNPT